MKKNPKFIGVILPTPKFEVERKLDNFSFELKSDVYEFSEEEIKKVEDIIREVMRNKMLTADGISAQVGKTLNQTFRYKISKEDEEYNVAIVCSENSSKLSLKIFVGENDLTVLN